MILGRSTLLWMGFITAVIGFLGIATPMFLPDVPKENITLFYGGLTAVAGGFVSLIAGTKATPTDDPRLPVGTVVNSGLPNEATVVKNDG